MLARNFLTPTDLKISQEWIDALVKTLDAMERGEIHHIPYVDVVTEGQWGEDEVVGLHDKFEGAFNMMEWNTGPSTCGSVCCIGGTAEILGNVEFYDGEGIANNDLPESLRELFHPGHHTRGSSIDWDTINVQEAAQALRNYLTTGEAQWRQVLGSQK